MKQRSSLAAALARWIAVSTAVSLGVFAATATLILQFAEAEEARATGVVEPLQEAFLEVGEAMLVAAPIGILLAVAAAWWLARRALARVAVISDAAGRMTLEQLDLRLPVSPAGDELDVLATALNGLFARIEDGVALQGQFAADASHELRSPLTVLASTLEVARRRTRSSEAWEAVADRALAETRHMTRLIEALLQLARAGGERRDEAVAVAELVEGVVARFAAVAAGAGVRLVGEAGEAVVRGDPELLTVALGNMVANAIGHSPADGVVRVTAVVAGERVEIGVSDEGPGVALAERERVFHPFVRGHAAQADRSGARVGLGLGLAITRRVIVGHGSQVTIADGPRGGAVFRFRLPRA